MVGAAVIDGSGRDPSNLDITVENGRITRLGASSAHGERLDAEGLTMTPGLIVDGGVVSAIAKGKVTGPRVLACGPVQCQIGGHGYYGAAWEPTDMID